MDRRHLIATLFVLVSAPTSAGGQASRPANSSASNSLARRVDSLFAREIRNDGPGCAVGVFKNGKSVLTRRYVPELPDYGTPIRIRDLIQHTSGLRDYGALEKLSGRQVDTMADFVGLLAAQQALHFTPGTEHEYSHSDYLLLGLVIERASGTPFGDHLASEVLRPLGMIGSAVHHARGFAAMERAYGHTVSPSGRRMHFPNDQTFGGTNLYASVEDLAGWDRNFEEPKVGGPAVIARMVGRPALPSGKTIPYAFGLRVGTYRGLRTVSRGGHSSGTRTEIIRFPAQHLGVAVLCNADHLEASRFAQRVADVYLEKKIQPTAPLPKPPPSVAVDASELSRYAGIYRPVDQPWNVIPIEVRNGALVEVLFDDVRGDTLFTMTPAGDGRFFEIGTTGNVGIFTFRSSPAGTPARLEISWNNGPAEVLDRVPDSLLWRPSATDLAEYAGVWFSPELDASWRIESRGERLVLRRQGQRDLELRPVQRDQFLRGFGSWLNALAAHLQFHRTNEGRLTHLSVSTPRGEDSAREVRFVRLAPSN